jgi:hypothetical protein
MLPELTDGLVLADDKKGAADRRRDGFVHSHLQRIFLPLSNKCPPLSRPIPNGLGCEAGVHTTEGWPLIGAVNGLLPLKNSWVGRVRPKLSDHYACVREETLQGGLPLFDDDDAVPDETWPPLRRVRDKTM